MGGRSRREAAAWVVEAWCLRPGCDDALSLMRTIGRTLSPTHTVPMAYPALTTCLPALSQRCRNLVEQQCRPRRHSTLDARGRPRRAAALMRLALAACTLAPDANLKSARRLRRAALVVLIVGCVVTAAAVVAGEVIPGHVTAARLERDMGASLNSDAISCKPARHSIWSCQVLVDSSRSGATYRLSVTSDSCYEAIARLPGHGLPRVLTATST